MMQYVECLHKIHNQSVAICRQIICVDNFCHNIIYHHPTSVYFFVNTVTISSMKLVWKYGRLSSIPFLKSSIPFHSASSMFHTEISVPFHFIFHSIPYHALSIIYPPLARKRRGAFIFGRIFLIRLGADRIPSFPIALFEATKQR